MKITDYKTMRVNWIKTLPSFAIEGGWYSEGDTAQLDDYEIEEMLEQNPEIEEIWYWYGHSSYEGVGQLLARVEDRYDLLNTSHCSCNGPVDDFVFTPHTLEHLVLNMSDDMAREVQCLFDAVFGNSCTFTAIRRLTQKARSTGS